MTKTKSKIRCENGIYYFQDGWKQTIADITKVYVKGTDDERGFQFGKLMRNEITAVLHGYLSFIMRNRSKIPIFLKQVLKRAMCLFKLFLRLYYGKELKRRINKYPAWMLAELEGMARGAGINPYYLKFMNIMGDNEQALGENQLNTPARSCCSFAFTGADGNIYHGKNLDWVLIEDHIDLICLQQREDETGNWFSVIGPPGLLHGYEFGMNSHGISIALTGRFYRGKRAARQVLTDAVELKILRSGKNLKEIQHIYDTGTGFNRPDALLIASDSDRDYQLFEVTPRGAAVTSAQAGKLFTTNTYIHPAFRQNNKQWGTIHEQRFRDPRYIRIKELMEQDPAALEDGFALLGDTVQPGFEHKNFLGQATINRFITQVSALLVHGEKPGAWIARDRCYAGFNRYIFFDYSPKPQKNIHKRPANHIINTPAFKNFKHFLHLRESRYDVSPRKLTRRGRKLMEKEPDNPVFILFNVQNDIKYGKFHRGLSLLKEHPLEWCADYWYCLGRCYRGTREYEAAKESFLKAMTLPAIDGFPELVQTVCLVQLIQVNGMQGLPHEVERLKQELKTMQSKFATPNIGMPDYPYINNICEQIENIEL